MRTILLLSLVGIGVATLVALRAPYLPTTSSTFQASRLPSEIRP